MVVTVRPRAGCLGLPTRLRRVLPVMARLTCPMELGPLDSHVDAPDGLGPGTEPIDHVDRTCERTAQRWALDARDSSHRRVGCFDTAGNFTARRQAANRGLSNTSIVRNPNCTQSAEARLVAVRFEFGLVTHGFPVTRVLTLRATLRWDDARRIQGSRRQARRRRSRCH
jgi:hypothetical protein